VPSGSGRLTKQWQQDAAIETAFQRSGPAVGEEYVFVGGLGSTFYALSKADGRVVWSFERDGSMADSSPWYREGSVYVGSGGGSIYALDASDGTVEWQWSCPSAVTSSPIVHDGVLYAGRNDGVLVAIDADDGSTVFQYDLGTTEFSELAYSSVQECVYLETDARGLSAHDATDGGRQVWVNKFGADVGSATPVVDDDEDLLYYASNEIRALATDDGTVQWGTAFYGTNAGSSPAFEDGVLYVGSADGKVYRVPSTDGVLVNSSDWEFQTWDLSIATDPVVVGEGLAVGTLSGTVFLLDTESGRELDQYVLECEIRANPAVDGDELFVAGHDGGVYAFELE